MLWQFGPKSGRDGIHPTGSLVLDKFGNFYGTTQLQGGRKALPGTIFELHPNGTGGWIEKILHVFHGTDGATPLGGLTLYSGILYGTTSAGGSSGQFGTVYELTHTHRGWSHSVVYQFAGGTTDGCNPNYETLIVDKPTHIYGTTTGCGANGTGTVFEIKRFVKGWRESVIHSFGAKGSGDGYAPWSGVTVKGNHVWGTTQFGGASDTGGVYSLFHSTQGWTESVVYSFGPQGSGDGLLPTGAPILGAHGHLYGTTALGGAADYGAVYEVAP